MICARCVELPQTTQGTHPEPTPLLSGMLEYKGMIPSLPYGETNLFGKTETAVDADLMDGILSDWRVKRPILLRSQLRFCRCFCKRNGVSVSL